MRTLLPLIIGIALGVYLADNNADIADKIRQGTAEVSAFVGDFIQ